MKLARPRRSRSSRHSLLAGCGGGGAERETTASPHKSADEIVGRRARGGQGARVRVRARRHDERRPAAQHRPPLVAGEGGEGHLEANGLSFEMVRVGDTAYFKGDEEFWRQFGGDAIVKLIGRQVAEGVLDRAATWRRSRR